MQLVFLLEKWRHSICKVHSLGIGQVDRQESCRMKEESKFPIRVSEHTLAEDLLSTAGSVQQREPRPSPGHPDGRHHGVEF